MYFCDNHLDIWIVVKGPTDQIFLREAATSCRLMAVPSTCYKPTPYRVSNDKVRNLRRRIMKLNASKIQSHIKLSISDWMIRRGGEP